MPYLLNNEKNALNNNSLLALTKKYNSPFWVYDAQIILDRIKQLQSFDIIRFAQKANSNIHILRLMLEAGVKVDAVSLGEIERALIAGYHVNNNEIIFTADLFDIVTLTRIIDLQIPVNAGSIDMLRQLGKISPNHIVWLRINPGFGYGYSKKTNTGGENSKHGIWYADLPLALSVIQQYGLHLAGIHMHIGSGLNYEHLQQVCNAMVYQVINLNQDIYAISTGGGLSIPYHYHEKSIDISKYYNLWNIARQRISEHLGHTVKIEIEPGRFLVAESGLLVSQVRAIKNMGRNHFVLIDAGFNDLVRPSMYGSYHHISLIPGDGRQIDEQNKIETIVAGPLCESGDIFTQLENNKIETRKLPLVNIGDYLVFHDTGAYGASMSSNYNSRPFIPEILFEKGKSREIRRAQTIQELLMLETIY